ncbi:MAG: sensor histidine kinase [Rhodospirillales bacterium]|nr:sensor histidine kinase [Rhodospirillales bacterium]
MLNPWLVIPVALAYLFLLFALAWWGDRRADQGKSLISWPGIYALSIAVYCTSWTFYGSVGRAASSGVGFLPIYLGPTLMASLWWILLRKMARVSKAQRVTSIADFLSARYGKSTLLGGLVTVIAVIGIMPYISLQLKAVSASFQALVLAVPEHKAVPPVFEDTAFYVALLLAAFAILFGTRHIDASERHEGMVAAIAFESLIKLVAFMAVGLFVCFGFFQSPAQLFEVAAADPQLLRLFTIPDARAMGDFVALTLLSGLVIITLPRQFQVAVVENVSEDHIRHAAWMFPLYLLLINIFVLPIALAGRLAFGPDANPDLFVLDLPLGAGQSALALFAFLGGLSAATGMIIVETVALATMVCNDLVMPALLRLAPSHLKDRADLSGLLLSIRRWAIVGVVGLGYLYAHFIGQSYALVSIGLVSFAAAAQFAPALLGGIFWKGGTRAGALCGLSAGALIWFYTLLLPSFARSGWISGAFIETGPFGLELLKPYALFGLSGFDSITHALIWSMLANLGLYVAASLVSSQGTLERIQATMFVDALKPAGESSGGRFWRGTAQMADLLALTARFIGTENAERAFAAHAAERGFELSAMDVVDADFVAFAERLLAGAIGAASARVMVASVAKGEVMGLTEVMEILDEASQVIAYSQKLEAASAELKAANERLTELDRLKDDFVSTVTHELRTPLTSIRSFSEILRDNPDLDLTQRQEFLRIVVEESERLTRLINQVLDLAKVEAGSLGWDIRPMDAVEVMEAALAATRRLAQDKGIVIEEQLPKAPLQVLADRDRLIQVLINLLSNAVKFTPQSNGRIRAELVERDDGVLFTVSDNGPGVPEAHHEAIFDKFRQVSDKQTGKPSGTGLGLAISRGIVEHLNGRVWVESQPGFGATFHVLLPRA